MTLNISDEKLSLSNLGGGAAIERFDDELRAVLDNIADPNTVENAAREVVLKVKIKPKERDYARVEIICSSKLAPADSYNTNIYIGADVKGRSEAFEHNPEQLKFQFEHRQQQKADADQSDKVRPITTEQKTN
ncbi:MAG: hypothetical protein HGJ93_00590 [Desulfosarcina sp.]|nr:hypothetical protein [Desulfosarcina sp.]MBC2764483.1 hypothetical protein [Desulfosarcina sp.]